MASDPWPPISDTLFGDPVVSEAKRRFDRCTEWESVARQRFMDDIRFVNGDSENGYQWPNAIRQARDTDARPCLTINIIRQHNIMISNEARKNKSSVKFIGLGNGATQESANVLADMMRQIEHQSKAQTAYSIARGFQIDAGIGWWRLVTRYADENSFDEEIFIEPVIDPLSIYIDPDCLQRDTSDAKFALVFDDVPRDDFYDAYPQWMSIASQQPLGVNSTNDDWVTKDMVRVCEYFRKVPREGEAVSFVDGGTRRVMRRDRLAKLVQDKAKFGEIIDHPTTRLRSVIDWDIEWKLIVGERIIDETVWPGKFIPLIPCKGNEVIIDGILDRKGHTRGMKDAQRMYNFNAALSLNTRIPTPNGWTTIGQIKDGDLIFDQKGAQVEVQKVLPIRYNEDCFEITFDTGYKIVTDAGHIWKVEERGKRKATTYDWKIKTVPTAELVAKKHFIKIAEPLTLVEKDLPIDPYLLGVWLGDGNTNGTRIYCHADDVEEEKRLISELGYTVGETCGREGNGAEFTVHGVRRKFAEIGLLGDKHVPAIYMRASRMQRLAVLQGLMDTDGHFAKAINNCVFVNKDPVIARAFLELCASLGIKTTVVKQPKYVKYGPSGKTYVSQETYRIQFTPDPDIPMFRLERKVVPQTMSRLVHWRRTKRIGIESVVKVDSVPVRCITLDTPEHLFLCGDGMIPTHNSAQVEFVALQSKTPWVVAAKAIEGHESVWNTANNVNHSVLPFNHIDAESGSEAPIPPPMRQDPPNAAPAYQAGMDTAFNQIMMTSGQWQNQMGMQGNERTGAAIQGRQRQSDTAVFHFQDWYEESLVYTGQQLIDLIPKIYDTRRVKRVMADNGVDYELVIDPAARQPYMQELSHQNDVIKRIFNPALGKYDVAPSVGPAYGSKREETRETLALILTQAPALTSIIGDLMLESMDFDKAQEAALRLRRMVPPMALGQGPTAMEQQLQAQVQQLQAALAESLQRQAKDQVKLVGKDQLRDIEAYDAETKRMAALAKMLPTDPEGLRALISQLVEQSLRTSITNIQAENAPPTGDEPQAESPPMQGAQKAPDGEYYLLDPTRKGKYLHVAPLAQFHNRPGIVGG